MNIILKTLMAVGITALCILGAGTYARAATVCEKGSWVEISETFSAAENTRVIKLNPEAIKSMVDKVGAPPSVGETEFDAYLVTSPPVAAVFVVQDGCLQDRLGPASVEAINKVLGLSEAQGERID